MKKHMLGSIGSTYAQVKSGIKLGFNNSNLTNTTLDNKKSFQIGLAYKFKIQ